MEKNGPFTFGHSSFIRSIEIRKEDNLYTHSLIVRFTDTLVSMAFSGNNVLKIFFGSAETAYEYESHNNEAYVRKHIWRIDTTREELECLYQNLVIATDSIPELKVARLTKKADGIRIRFAEEHMSTCEKKRLVSQLRTNLEQLLPAKSEPVIVPPTVPIECYKTAPGQITKVCTKTEKGKKMKDFSLTNLKDALVDKVTHLDRRTVMILAIIALVLLIVGKYTTIKDIAKGIKDKVKRSKNFKAMVEDGTNAINGLKKIVGVKSGDKDEA